MSTSVSAKEQSAESYRKPMLVTHLRVCDQAAYYVCPRCGATVEREFMLYCDRCGQCLNWKSYKKAIIVR